MLKRRSSLYSRRQAATPQTTEDDEQQPLARCACTSRLSRNSSFDVNVKISVKQKQSAHQRERLIGVHGSAQELPTAKASNEVVVRVLASRHQEQAPAPSDLQALYKELHDKPLEEDLGGAEQTCLEQVVRCLEPWTRRSGCKDGSGSGISTVRLFGRDGS